MTVFTPDTEQEIARILGSSNGVGFEPTGQSRTAKTPQHCVLSAEAMSGIVFHNPVDMTITARAGTKLKDLSNHLRDFGQTLSFDLPLALQPGRALTVGSAVALNLPSSRRPFSGSVRDAVLGTRFVTGLGEVVTTGSRVLKNAAGLDLSRVLCGSKGHLGFLTEVTFRVSPLPVHEQTGIFSNIAANDFPACLATLLKSGWDISGAAYLSEPVACGLGLDAENCMLIRTASGFRPKECLDAHLTLAQVVSDTDATVLWASIASGQLITASGQGTCALISCNASSGGKIAAMFEATGASIAMDWRGSLVWLGLDRTEDRELLNTVLLQFPDAILRWQSPGQDSIARLAPLDKGISQLKSALDPLKRFRPGTSFTYLQI